MPPPITSRAKRRKLERDLKKESGRGIREDSVDIIKKLKYTLPTSQANVIFNNSFDKFKSILPPDLPKSYREIRSTSPIYPFNEIEKEITWQIKFFIINSKVLKEFIVLQRKFEELFVVGQYDLARGVLQEINSTICYSHWSIEKMLLLAEYESGFKQNKEALTVILDKENNIFTNLLAKYHSIRIEKNLSYFKYSEVINSYIDLYKDGDGLREYFRFKLDYFSADSYEQLGYLLNVESSASIIDRYVTFVDAISQFVSQKEAKKFTDSVEALLIELYLEIRDQRFISVLFSLNKDVLFDLDVRNRSFISILEDYTKGNYREVVDRCSKFLLANPLCFELYEIYIKSCHYVGSDNLQLFAPQSLAAQCLEDMGNIISKNNETQHALINAHKTFNSIGLNSWTYNYHLFFSKEHSWESDRVNSMLLGCLRSYYINPICATSFNESTGIKFLDEIGSQVHVPAIVSLIKSIIQKSFNDSTSDLIDPFRKGLYKTKLLLDGNLYKEAINELQLIESLFPEQNDIQHSQETILSIKIHCYLSLEMW
ncbi:MAG TPA: hypothetical protein VGN64_25130, partial [Dyadobacter sp.]|nr:hypothetical protein [Dyadobacter sp.]